MKFLSVLILGLFISVNSSAGWSGKVKITSVFIYNDATALITLSNFNNPYNCDVNKGSVPDAGHVIFDPSKNKSLYSLILTSYASGKDVNIYVSGGCTPIWAGSSYANLVHVRSY